MTKLETRELIRMWIETENRRQLSYFTNLSAEGGHYTTEQKKHAIDKVKSIGVRATSRLLHVTRRTIQRWLRQKGLLLNDVQTGFMIGHIGEESV